MSDLDAGLALEPHDLVEELRGRDRDHAAGLAGSRRTTGAVEVSLRVARGVEVHDQVDAVDVEPAGGDVGRHDGLDLTLAELVEVALTHSLTEVAMQVDGVDALAVERLGEVDRGFPGAGEHDRLAVGPHQRSGGRDLLLEAADDERVVGHRGDRTGAGIQLVELRVAQVRLDQRIDVAVEGCAEQHPLAAGGRHPDQLVDSRVEAEVAQVVGLIEDRDLDVLEEAVTLLQQVVETTRRGDHDVGALAQLAGLALVRRAAVDRDHLQVHRAGERLDRLGDLVGQLASGHDDDRARVARAGLLASEAGQDRKAEGECLAGAGLSATEDVLAAHRVGDDRRLDGGRRGDALLGQYGDQSVRELPEDTRAGRRCGDLDEGVLGHVEGVVKGGRGHANLLSMWRRGRVRRETTREWSPVSQQDAAEPLSREVRLLWTRFTGLCAILTAHHTGLQEKCTRPSRCPWLHPSIRGVCGDAPIVANTRPRPVFGILDARG